MIGSRRKSVILAALLGLLSFGPAIALAALEIPIGDAAGGGGPVINSTRILLSLVLPTIVMVGPIVLLSRSGNRTATFGAGIGAYLFGYVLLFGWNALANALFVQDIVWVNATGQEVVIYEALEGRFPTRSYPLAIGEETKKLSGYRREGSGLRFVALSTGSSTVRLKDLEGQSYYDLFPGRFDPSVAGQVGTRLLFDQTFTWDELRRLGGRVVISGRTRQ